MMKTMIMLAVTAVLFAITSNVAEAAKINPNPMDNPAAGGTVFAKAHQDCSWDREMCEVGIFFDCVNERKDSKCRLEAKARCDEIFKTCIKTERKE